MKSFVVIGLGRFGTATAKKLCELGHEVLAVDEDENKIQHISDHVTHAVIADAKEEQNLKALGVRNYDCAILAIGHDIADSVLITLALKEMGVKEVICKARDSQHKKILLKIGADRVIIPEFEAGTKLAVQIADMNLIEFLELSDTFGISEMTVPTRWLGKTLKQVDVRKKYRCTVVAIRQRAEDKEDVVIAPGPDYQFKTGDIVVIIGSNEDINILGRM